MGFPKPTQAIPSLTTTQMVEVDRRMIQEYKIELIQMMENAGRNLAQLARARFLAGNPAGKTVIILAGSGGNGGGALVSARWLHNWGARVFVFLSRHAEDFTPVAAHQLDIVRRLGIPVAPGEQISFAEHADLVIDGLVGYSLDGAPNGTTADLIRWANRQPAPVLALDVPSGVDTTTGKVFEPAIQAAATLALALTKKGLEGANVKARVGELYLADIGVPPQLYEKVDPEITVANLFAESEILRLW